MPAARFSKSEATITTPRDLASSQKACVLVPLGISLGEGEMGVVLALAEIGGAKEFLRGDDLRALVGGGVGELERPFQVGNGIRIGPGLEKTQFDFLRCGHGALF